jgi:hypothetical protein
MVQRERFAMSAVRGQDDARIDGGLPRKRLATRARLGLARSASSLFVGYGVDKDEARAMAHSWADRKQCLPDYFDAQPGGTAQGDAASRLRTTRFDQPLR